MSIKNKKSVGSKGLYRKKGERGIYTRGEGIFPGWRIKVKFIKRYFVGAGTDLKFNQAF